MLTNAVSSALERLYAAAPVASDRSPVQRILAIPRAHSVGQDGAGNRDDREQATHRQALARGVQAVFESSSTAETQGSSGADVKQGGDNASAAAVKPDPQLEEAIMRFLHTMFRTLAVVEGGDDKAQSSTSSGSSDAGASPTVPAVSGASNAAASTPAGVTAAATKAREAAPPVSAERVGMAISASRSALGARIGALAQRYANAPASEAAAVASSLGAEKTPQTAASAATANQPDPALSQAFADVLQAMRGGSGGGTEVSRNSRAELVNLMQRLAQAMQGAPPVDPGLPTRGGLLSTSA